MALSPISISFQRYSGRSNPTKGQEQPTEGRSNPPKVCLPPGSRPEPLKKNLGSGCSVYLSYSSLPESASIPVDGEVHTEGLDLLLLVHGLLVLDSETIIVN